MKGETAVDVLANPYFFHIYFFRFFVQHIDVIIIQMTIIYENQSHDSHFVTDGLFSLFCSLWLNLKFIESQALGILFSRKSVIFEMFTPLLTCVLPLAAGCQINEAVHWCRLFISSNDVFQDGHCTHTYESPNFKWLHIFLF